VDAATLLGAMGTLGGVGLAFGVLIAAAHRKLKVWEDPRIDAVAGLLPGANCGACGSAGCRAFAEKLVKREAQPVTCTVSGAEGHAAIATYLGVEAGTAVKRVARLLCAGGSDVAVQQARYRGFPSCAAAAAVSGGGKGCTWGCIGLADCADACTFGAIRMDDTGIPVVDPAACTACGDCVEACPKDLFTILPVTRRLLVQCRNRMVGDSVVSLCRVGCTACGICAVDADPGLVSIVDGLAVVDPARDDEGNRKAVARCPTTAIAWVEGAQFAAPRGATEGVLSS
jgi:Na+-translocating ferredoxin:NAD+ oxidoreductase RNF subunit RnfB